MAELTVPQDAPSFIKEHTVESGLFTVGESTLQFFVLSPAFRPEFPEFFGFHDKRFPYVSAAVPEAFRLHVVGHEVIETIGLEGRELSRVDALRIELAGVPLEMQQEYISWRRKNFQDFYDYHAEKSDKRPFQMSEIEATADFLQLLRFIPFELVEKMYDTDPDVEFRVNKGDLSDLIKDVRLFLYSSSGNIMTDKYKLRAIFQPTTRTITRSQLEEVSIVLIGYTLYNEFQERFDEPFLRNMKSLLRQVIDLIPAHGSSHLGLPHMQVVLGDIQIGRNVQHGRLNGFLNALKFIEEAGIDVKDLKQKVEELSKRTTLGQYFKTWAQSTEKQKSLREAARSA